ncbi:MAG: hypothetical protein EA424_23155 [Planctomycetaceae bacterium]|nr:MAG: hypothetical protein EA424_23155 [Planctomycetaceae bacterium]
MNFDPNPYQSSNVQALPAKPRRKFRWRAIPMTLMVALGGLLALAAIFQAFCGAVWFWHYGATATFLRSVNVIAFALLPSVGAVIWLYSAVCWRRGWWIRAIVTACAGYGALGLTDAITPRALMWPPF